LSGLILNNYFLKTMVRKVSLFLTIPFLAVASNLTVPFKGLHFLLQIRYDYGNLLYRNGDFKTKGDLYIRRFRLIFKRELSQFLSIKLNLAADRWFQDYKKGKEEEAPKKVIFKAAYIKWKPLKNFYLSLGRNKKPITRAGLNSSKNLLLVDKPELYLELKKFLGDYYATQLEVGGFFFKKLSLTVANSLLLEQAINSEFLLCMDGPKPTVTLTSRSSSIFMLLSATNFLYCSIFSSLLFIVILFWFLAIFYLLLD